MTCRRALMILGTALLLLLGACSERDRGQGTALLVEPDSTAELQEIFARHNYDLGTLEEGVPRLILSRLPEDLEHLPEVSERKRIFFLSLLPMVLMANEEIAWQREELFDLFSRADNQKTLGARELAWLEEIAAEYRVNGDPLTNPRARTLLLRRVDVLPVSLVLAQAANESGWGTSRFARQGNNLFGEWTFTPGTGLVPIDRPDGATYEVRRFDSVYESLQSYMRNLNTNTAYLPLREVRARLRAEGLPLTGLELAPGLENYSIRREAYVRDIDRMIRQNRLSLLAEAALKRS